MISGNTIEIYFISEQDDTESLYWAGNFEVPADGSKKFTYESINDKEKTDNVITASGDDSKTFTYSDGIISYKVSALGTTQTVKLKKINDK